MTFLTSVCIGPLFGRNRKPGFVALVYAGFVLAVGSLHAATLPAGFIETTIPGPNGGDWNEAAGILFDDNVRMYVWERSGRVWIQDDGDTTWSLLIDISDEVGAFNDHGLLGFALDPNFVQNGYIYMMYVVDRHHLMNFGTPNYNPNANDYFSATIGRITRYTANQADGFRTVDLATRKVLLGETRQTGIPILFDSHGVGTLVFGTDGTLLASCGDGSAYTGVDTGSRSDTYYLQALTDGIIRTSENVGAYRSQMINSLNGKVLRLDPATGDGVPGNPFYDPENPRAPRSRVWNLGLRNPYRIAILPGSGSHNREDANPGILFIGDVGWNTWEDMHVSTGPGLNFGWPAFEGMTAHPDYYNANILNRDAPNPFYGVNGCNQQYLYFNQLIKQDSLNPISFTDSCGNPIPASIPTFRHTRPALDWQHGNAVARTGTYNGAGNATTATVGAAGSPVSGSAFSGSCSVGGVWYEGDDFPDIYRNTYFHADFTDGWIRNFVFDANYKPTAVRSFANVGEGVVGLATHPINGGLYYIFWTTAIRRIDYAPNGNFPPKAVATGDKYYGPGPLTVQFTGSNSSDPEGLPLTYFWNFGDGSPTNNQANPVHTFNAPDGVPTQYNVSLVVRDSAGATASARLIISVNNTPPVVNITSPVEGTKYPLTDSTIYNLTADVSDSEYSNDQLRYEWVTYLHHNTHQHAGPADTNHATTTVIAPAGCDGNIYYYRVELTVTDPAGLATTREVRLFPDCPEQSDPIITWPQPNDIIYGAALTTAQLNATADVPGTFYYDPPIGTVLKAGSAQVLKAFFTPADALNYRIAIATNTLNVLPAPLVITADDKVKIVGAPLPELTATYQGFVNNDTPFVLDTPVLLTTPATADSPAGGYPIIASGATDVNYTVTHVNGTLTVVTQLPPVITLSPSNLTFDVIVGGNAPDQSINISNSGGGNLSWTVTNEGDGQDWLSVSPSQGTNNTSISVSVNSAGLAVGSFQRTLSIAALGAENSPQTVSITLNVHPRTTGRFEFTYTNRAALLADGWDFLARSAGGMVRNTETTSGAVVSFDQTVHPGRIRIPVDIGDLWADLNDTQNSLFRNLPPDWTSVRVRLAFAPTQNYQYASTVVYQDDDNYLQVMRTYDQGNKWAFVRELDGDALNINTPSVTAVSNLYQRLDRNIATGVITAYYSLNGSTWTSLGAVTQTLNNPRLGIVTGASPGGFPVADFSWVEIYTSSSTTNPVLLVSANTLNFSTARAGSQIVTIANGGGGVLNWTASVGGSGPNWLSVNPSSGNSNATLTVSVDATGLTNGIYERTITVAATGATNSPHTINVTLDVSQNILTVVADPKTKVFGEIDPLLTYQIISGSLAEGDVLTGSLSRVAGEDAGEYAIEQGSLTAGPKYDLTYIGANFTILKSNVSLVLSELSHTYDGDAHPVSVATDPEGLAVVVTYNGDTTVPTNAGNYEVIGEVLELNYSGSVTGVLAIARAPLNVAANDAVRLVGQTNPIFSGVLTGVLPQDGISVSYSSEATTGSPPGLYPVIPELIDPYNRLDNYTVTSSSGILTVVDVPRLLDISQSAEGVLIVSWRVHPGRIYQCQWKADLMDAEWTPLLIEGQESYTAFETMLEVHHATGGAKQGFYRMLDVTP